MLLLTSETKVLLAIEPIDFRKQIDGLVALCHRFGKQPNNGTYYIFINRAKTMIKILSYEEGGYWLAVKRLSRGKYVQWPRHGIELSEMLAHELRVLLKNSIVYPK
jgi:transposase